MNDSPYEYRHLTGSPGELLAKAQTYKTLAEQMSASMDSLKAITDEQETVSRAMKQLRELASEVRESLTKTNYLYANTADVLMAYGNDLTEAKRVADNASDARNSLITSMAYPYKKKEEAKTQRDDAREILRDLPDDATTGERQRAQAAVDDAQWLMDYYQGILSDTKRQIAQQERIWRNNDGHGGGLEYKEQRARAAIDALQGVFSATEVAGLADPWWDRFYEVASAICDVASFLSLFLSWVPILGQILLVITLVGSLLTMIDTVLKFIHGEIGWGALITGLIMGLTDILSSKLKAVFRTLKVAKGYKLQEAGSELVTKLTKRGKLITKEVKIKKMLPDANSAKSFKEAWKEVNPSKVGSKDWWKTMTKAPWEETKPLKWGTTFKNMKDELIGGKNPFNSDLCGIEDGLDLAKGVDFTLTFLVPTANYIMTASDVQDRQMTTTDKVFAHADALAGLLGSRGGSFGAAGAQVYDWAKHGFLGDK